MFGGGGIKGDGSQAQGDNQEARVVSPPPQAFPQYSFEENKTVQSQGDSDINFSAMVLQSLKLDPKTDLRDNDISTERIKEALDILENAGTVVDNISDAITTTDQHLFSHLYNSLDILSPRMQLLISKSKYCILQLVKTERGSNEGGGGSENTSLHPPNSIPMLSTPQVQTDNSTQFKQQQIFVKDEKEYNQKLQEHYIPYLDINKTPYITWKEGSNNNPNNISSESDVGYTLPTLWNIIKYVQQQIRKEINDRTESVADQAAVSALAPILSFIINQPAEDENLMAFKDINEFLTKLDEKLKNIYATDEDGEWLGSVNLSTSIYPFYGNSSVADLKVTNPYLLAFLKPFVKEINGDNPSLKLEAGINVGIENVKSQIEILIERAKEDIFLGPEEIPQQDDVVIKELNALIPDSLRVAIDVLINLPKEFHNLPFPPTDELIKCLQDQFPPVLTIKNIKDKKVVKLWKRFIILLYHTDKSMEGVADKLGTEIYEISDPEQERKHIIQWMLKMGIELQRQERKKYSIQWIIPRPNKDIKENIWKDIGGIDGLIKKLNIKGALLNQKGGKTSFEKLGISAKNTLSALNDTLIRSILFIVLKKFDCLTAKDYPYSFPLFPVQYTEEFQVLTDDDNKAAGIPEVNKRIQDKKKGKLLYREIEDYEYYRPLFVNIFSGEQTTGVNIRTATYNSSIDETWGDISWLNKKVINAPFTPYDGLTALKKDPSNNYTKIYWDKIYGAAPVQPPLNLEIRKMLARRLFLNVQILVLYWQLIADSRVFFGDPKTKPQIITKSYFLQALGFLIDKKTTKKLHGPILDLGDLQQMEILLAETRRWKRKMKQTSAKMTNETWRPESKIRYMDPSNLSGTKNANFAAKIYLVGYLIKVMII